MADANETLELLSAYLCGDVTPAESDAVTQLLASDPAAQALEKQLRELLPTLKLGHKPVRAAVLNALRQRLDEQIASRTNEMSMEALLAASLSGDLEPREREILVRHLAKNAVAQSELNSLRELSTNLKQGERAVSAALSQKLAERLNSKLPLAARVGKAAPQSEPAVLRPVSERQSLRVYAQAENPWNSRALWASAAIAATVLFSISAWHIFRTEPTGSGVVDKSTNGANVPQPNIDNTDAHLNHTDVAGHEKSLTPPQSPNDLNRLATAPAPEKLITKIPQPEHQAPLNVAPEVVRQEEPAPLPLRPLTIDPKKPAGEFTQDVAPQPEPFRAQPKREIATVIPTVSGPIDSAAISKSTTKTTTSPTVGTPSAAAVVDNTNNTTAGTQNGTSTGIPTTPNGTLAALQPAKVVTSEPAPAQIQEVVKPAGPISVALLKDGGNAIATIGGKPMALKAGDVLQSGTEIITEGSRVLLTLPDARLYVNHNSRLTLRVRREATDIVLISGEISYNGANNAQLTLTTENKSISISRASAVDVKIENNALTLYVIRQLAIISKNGKALGAILANNMASATLNGSDAPQKSSFANSPDAWRSDMADPTVTEEKNVNGKGRRK